MHIMLISHQRIRFFCFSSIILSYLSNFYEMKVSSCTYSLNLLWYISRILRKYLLASLKLSTYNSPLIFIKA